MLWLNQIDYWHWWLLSGALLILELSTPKVLFLLIGIVAASVGFLVFAFPALSSATQLAVFGVLSVVAVIGWWRIRDG